MNCLYELRKKKKGTSLLLTHFKQTLFLHCFKDFEEQYQPRAKKSKTGNQGML